MENGNTRPAREIVVPGELLNEGDLRAGNGTYVQDGKVYASLLGVKSQSSSYVNVIPLGGRYMPQPGDSVVGVVIDIGPSNWIVEIDAPYPAPMHVSEVPWKVEFGDTARFLNVGQVILAKVLMVDETMKVQVTLNESGLRRLEGGLLVDVSHSRIPRIIGKGGSMIQMIQNLTDCRIFVGQNGRIWIDGELPNMLLAEEAINMISEEAHTSRLTERVKEFLESRADTLE